MNVFDLGSLHQRIRFMTSQSHLNFKQTKLPYKIAHILQEDEIDDDTVGGESLALQSAYL